MNDPQKDLDQLDQITNSPTESREDFLFPRSVVFGALLLFGGVLVLLFWQIQSRLVLKIPSLGDDNLAFEAGQISLLEREDSQLKEQDSDEDGLNDYEELRVYATSPFIADSDSDGLTDEQEVTNGEDPNCPRGQQCLGLDDKDKETEVVSNIFQADELQNILSNPEQIRELLIKSGANPELIKNLDNQTLQILAQEAFVEFSKPLPDTKEELLKTDIEQLRKILKTRGISEEELAQFTDEDLKQVFQELLPVAS